MTAHLYTYRSTRGERAATYCERCRRGFKSEYAINEHFRDSRCHWECPGCDYDADGWDDLLDHCRETNCRSVCQGCDDGNGEHWSYDSTEFWQRFHDQNACTDCEQHFDTHCELEQHDCPEYSGIEPDEDEGYDTEVSENEACGTQDCYGDGYDTESADDEDDSDADGRWVYPCLRCDREFATYGGMILHLESGSCSEVDCIRLNALAAKCRKWREFVCNDTYWHWHYMVTGYDTSEYELYYCPICELRFAKLSGLFQHVESTSCEQELGEDAIGTLQRYLEAYIDT